MPIYEYACLTCGAHFEKLVHGQVKVACPSCEGERVNRQLSVVGVRTGSRFSNEPAGAAGGGGGCCGGGCGCH